MRLNGTEVGNIVKSAVASNAKQHIALVYSAYDIISDPKIDTEKPLTLQEIFNSEEDVTPGNCCSANLEAHIANTDRALSDFNFARNFGLYFGVEVLDDDADIPWTWSVATPVFVNGLVIGIYNNKAYIALDTATADYTVYTFASAMDEGENLAAVYATGGTVHLITDKGVEKGRIRTRNSGATVADRLISVTTASVALATYTAQRILASAEQGISEFWDFTSATGCAIRHEFVRTAERSYERTTAFVAINVFKGVKPRRLLSDDITIMANDILTVLDADALPYMTTTFDTPKNRATMLTDIFAQVSTDTGVQFARGGLTVELGTDTYATNPFANYDGMTYRDLLKMIAESAGVSIRLAYFTTSLYASGNIVFNPYLEFRYFDDTPTASFNAGDYYDLELDEYSVTPVQRVRVQASDADIGVILPEDPDGDNTLAIIDNPLLIGDSETAIKAHCTKIYDNLDGQYSGAYRPGTLTMAHDLLTQVGDRIRVQADLEDESVKQEILAFTITTTWNGYAECTIESTGQPKRDTLTKSIKQSLRSGRRWHEYEVTVDGLKSRMGNAEGDISDLESTAESLALRMTNTEGDVSELENTAESLGLRLTNAEGSVTELTATAGQLTMQVTAMDSPQILRNTKFLTSPFGQDGADGIDWEHSKWGRAVGSANTDYIAKAISDCPNAHVTRGIRMKANASYDTAIYQDKIPTASGDRFVVSGYFRSNTAGAKLTVYAKQNSSASISTEWTYTASSGEWQYASWPITQTSDSLKIGFVCPNTAGVWLELCGLKLEVGTSATAWCDADEYTFSRVTQTEAKILTEMQDALGNYYTKTETASLIQTEMSDALGNYYTKSETATQIQTKMTDALGNYYTKTETASEISTYVGNHTYGLVSGIDIKPAGVEISGGKYVAIKAGGSFSVDSGNFSIDTSGNVSFKGDVQISSGKSLAIKTGGSFTVESGNFSIDSSGNVSFKGDVQISSGKSLSIKTGGSFTIDSGNFSIDSSGNVSFKGAVEITSGKSLSIKSGGSFTVASGNFTINDSGELTAGSYKLSAAGFVYNNGTSSFGITAATAGTTNLGTSIVSNGHILFVPTSGNNGYFQLYSDSTVLQLLPQPLVGSSGGISKVRQSVLGGPAQTDIWDEGYFVDIYYTNTYQQSSREMKKDIEPIDIPGEVIDALTPVSFRYKEGADRLHYGLIHEDTLPLLPAICKGDADTDPRKKAIDYTELIAVLLSEVQHLRARVTALEA